MDRVRFEAGEAMSTDTRESTEKQSPALLEACTVFVAMVLAAVGLSAVFSDFAWLPPSSSRSSSSSSSGRSSAASRSSEPLVRPSSRNASWGSSQFSYSVHPAR